MHRGTLRSAVAVLFLTFQLGMIAYARFSSMRYYAWAPHDAQNEYRIEVVVDGRVLSEEQVVERYRDRWRGLNPRAIEHVKRLIRKYESTWGREDGARVRMTYRTNGGPVQEWTWPTP